MALDNNFPFMVHVPYLKPSELFEPAYTCKLLNIGQDSIWTNEEPKSTKIKDNLLNRLNLYTTQGS